MPFSKHHKNNRINHDDARNNNDQNVFHAENENRRMEGHGCHNQGNGCGKLQRCCVPFGCRQADELIDPDDPYNGLKVVCNNEACTVGTWMHKDCFTEWEQSVLAYLRSCGRARSWSEKQRLQNLWTKKGYDLAYKACDCKCGRGHLRKDLDYIPPVLGDSARKARKNKKKNDKPMPVVSTNHKSGYNNNGGQQHHVHHSSHDNETHLNASKTPTKKNSIPSTNTKNGTDNKRRGSDNTVNNNSFAGTININDDRHETLDNGVYNSVDNAAYVNNSGTLPSNSLPPLRLRTNSVSSTGSIGSQGSSASAPSSAGSISPLSSSPINGNIFFKGKKCDAYDGTQPGIFRRRQDYSAFTILPRYKQNPYNIHMEDESMQEDDETRNFVLSNLTTKRMTALRCVLCKDQLPVFDRYPLVDGTLFLSPQAYDQFVVQVIWEGRIQFLNAICIGCLEGSSSEAKCASCKRKWDGTSFVIGTMYTYDIFAAMPCCQKRLTCKHCCRAVIDVAKGLNYYSQYSQMIICPYCKANDYHFIRPLVDTFILKDPICG